MAKRTFRQTLAESLRTFVRLMALTKGNRVIYFGGMFLSACQGLIHTVVFGMSTYWILSTAQQGDLNQTLKVGLGVLLLCIFLEMIYTVGAWVLDYGIMRVSTRARYQLMDHMLKVPASWYDQHHSGDIVTRLFHDYEDGIQLTMNIPIQFTLNMLLTGIGSIIAIFALDWRIALALMGVSALSLLLTSRFVVASRAAANDVRRGNSAISESLTDIVGAAPVLRVHSLYDLLLGFLHDKIDQGRISANRQGKIIALQNSMGEVVTLLIYVGVLSVGLVGMDSGTVDAAKLIAMLQLSRGPINLFTGLGRQLVEVQNGLAGAERVFQIWDIPEESYGETVDPLPDAPAIVLSHVKFAYKEDTPILRDASLEVRTGSKTALMGESGGGKSTILKLLSGLYPYEGSVKVFGHEVRGLPRNAVNRLLAYVPQDPHMFIGTIEENIALAKKGATSEEIRSAAKLADAHTFIEELPDGYGYMVSERGSNLSGGQKQRIALARAFLRDIPLLLLDEPTSALDTQSEARVTAVLGGREGGTLFVATHRPSLLQVMEETLLLGR